MKIKMTLTGTIRTSTIVLICIISSSMMAPLADAQTMTSSLTPSGKIILASLQNQKDNVNNANTNPATSDSSAAGGNKTFYVFTEEMEGINETKLGIPSDIYSPNILVANHGDLVTIHFYNLDAGDRHTFTINSPYNINEDVSPLHNATFTFKASNEGVYRFYCTYHQPTMAGQLIVLPSATVLKTLASK